MSSTCSVSFYSTIRLIFCICLYRHCLKWKLQPIMCNWIERLCLPHWWPLLQNLLFFLCVCHQNENPLFVRVNKQWFAAYVLSIKSSSRTRYMHFPCDVLPKPTYKLYNLANFPGQFLNVESRQKNLFVSEYSLSSPAKKELFFLSHQWIDSKETRVISPNVKLLPKI